VNDLGKKYRIRHQRRERYVALRDVIADGFRNALRGKADDRAAPATEDFWALKEVSFEVKRGEVIGIIGRNGAGKSTLLKVISRITEPNEGRIYLNGAILGMRRAEIKRRFDEIVAFAEVENFLDTPVKRFSSGMYVRLAFAVAAHLETEILIVDEVLAVGDAEFQKRCLGKMSQAAQGGRTVLFVSHNMGSIRRLTRRCILLDRGKVMVDAAVETAIDSYLKQAAEGISGGIYLRTAPRPADQPFFVNRVTTRVEPDSDPASQFDCDHPIAICVEYTATRPVVGLYAYVRLQRLDGTVVYEGDSNDSGVNPFDRLPAGSGTAWITIPERILGAGTYQIFLSFASGFDPAGPEVDIPGVVGEFRLDDTGTRRGNRRNGFLSLKLPWQMVEQRQ
jgi:lipopolysaccharide transport system ATP-binding protein